MDTASLSAQDKNDVEKLIHAIDLREGRVSGVSLINSLLVIGVLLFCVFSVFWFMKYPFLSMTGAKPPSRDS